MSTPIAPGMANPLAEPELDRDPLDVRSGGPDDSTVPRQSLKALTVRGSTWTLVEYGISQVLRLASNLILARILFPEAFGKMLIVSVFMQALDMFSDIGIGPSIIQNKRGEDERFLKTAWTLQAIRGACLSVCALAIAWPVAFAYRDPQLAYLLAVAGLSGTISGLSSTNLHLLNRKLALQRLTILNLGTQALSIVVTVSWAWLMPSVWALVAGGVAANLIRMVASHLFCPGPRSRFAWDPEASREVFHFGKWIFVSTLLGFLASRGDQLILGAYLDSKAQFGIYGIASFLAQGVVQGLHSISGRVLFPVYARLAEEGPERLRRQTFRVRAVLMALSVPPVCALVVWGPLLVDLLYDDRYIEAGWMLQILSVGAIASVIGSTIGPVLLAVGDSYRFMIIQASRTAILCGSMALGGFLYGMPGVIVGVAVPEFLLYPILVLCVRKYGVWLPALDLTGLAAAAALIALGFSL